MTLGEIDRLKANPKVVVTVAPRQIAGEYMAFLNTRNKPLDRKEVRQALYYAMNRAEMLEKAGFGFGKVSAGPISSEQPTFYTDKVRRYDTDVARAEKMLDEAGLPRDAKGIRFSIRVNYDQKEGPMDAVARLMRAQFARIGVDLKVMPMDTGAWREAAFKNWDFDVTMGSFATGPDPAISVDRLYSCKTIERLTARNASGYCNPELDKLLESAAQENDETKRIALYHRVQEHLAENVPHWWLWDRYYPIAYRAGLEGLPADPTAYGPFDKVKWK
jgi:peptide/nickel transport system substrate-binding protein